MERCKEMGARQQVSLIKKHKEGESTFSFSLSSRSDLILDEIVFSFLMRSGFFLIASRDPILGEILCADKLVPSFFF